MVAPSGTMAEYACLGCLEPHARETYADGHCLSAFLLSLSTCSTSQCCALCTC
ncbi:hypothetical protein A2U01_0096437, partial [Trifolium medium]|nr:hypothetical protein [Trifolium medium]